MERYRRSYAGWPQTQAGQHDELQAVRDVMLGLPHNLGEGVLYWYPEAVQVDPNNIWKGGAIAMFNDTNHDILPSVSVLAPIHGDFNGDGHFNAADIPEMLSALADLSTYKSARGFTSPDMKFLGDFNNDSKFSNADIQGMLDALKAGGGSLDPVPEPAAWLLLTVGAMMLVSHKKRRFLHRSAPHEKPHP